MAEEEEKKKEEEQSSDEKKEEPKKSEPEPKAEEKQPPAQPSEVPTVGDIEDVLKEVMEEEPPPPEAEAPKPEDTPLPEMEEKEIVTPKPELPVTEDKPEIKEEIVAQPEEKTEGGEKPKETVAEELVKEIKEEPKIEEPKPAQEPGPPTEVEEERVEETKPAQEEVKPEKPRVEVPKPAQEPEPPKENEVQREKAEGEKAPPEKAEDAKIDEKPKPPRDTKAQDEKPKKADRKEVSEKPSDAEKPAPRKTRKPPAEDHTMIISPLIFGRFDLREVEVTDPGLRKYINLSPVGIPHTGARHANRWLGKTKINIVERLINNLMRTEHSTGKKSFSYKAVNNAFNIIAKRTKKNPIQVLVDALQNSSPKEEITRLRFGGISVPKAVDTSSSRRLDIALRNICKGAVSSSHRNKKRMEMCLAEEIILASKGDMNSFAISKKEETERIAASAR